VKHLILAVGLLVGCSESSGPPPSGSGGAASTRDTVGTLQDFLGDPAYPDDFWQTETFEASGVDKAKIDTLLSRWASSRVEVHSLLIAHRGRLVVERYGFAKGENPDHPGTPHQVLPDEPHELYSTTKSFLSALIGIALDDGSIPSIDDPAAGFFPDYEDLNPSPEKDAITLEDLITMRSGLEWTVDDDADFNPADPAREMLSRPIVNPPGEVWQYASGNSDILAEILRTATGQTPLEFANERLFGPLGIESPTWLAADNGTERGGFGLVLTSRQMARFGELYRNSGTFLDEQVVPAAWTDESTTARAATDWGGQYAYHFWVPDGLPGFFNTLGAWGQVIYVSRELELVVVITADMPNETANSEFKNVIRNFVAPAVTGG